MSAGLINLGFGTTNQFGSPLDIVGIYGNGGSTQADFGQMFMEARPIKATVRETSKVMEHPVETGVMLADHHIINPVEIDMVLIVNTNYYLGVYAQIRQAFVNATALSVQCRSGIYSNMIIADMPHEESPEMYDVITIGLHLKEVLFVLTSATATTTDPANYSPADPTNNDIVQSGLQSATPAPSPIESGGATGSW